ncbi:MAG: aspartate kinase [Bacteroidales bacterium]|nr:aspartate kinase [Bacteroidales bacterium]MCF8390836.1 aspartate kinase [Bacteroidales bacterium]
MYVFKFGGASVKNAESVKNLAKILQKFSENIVVVISAMGKSTNALEQIADFFFTGNQVELNKSFDDFKNFHFSVMKDLFVDSEHSSYKKVNEVFEKMQLKISGKASLNYDFDYDQIVSYGEILSTLIVCEYLKEIRIKAEWMDIRESLKTDNKYREAKVDWQNTEMLMKQNFLFEGKDILVTQGFLGSTINNLTTTLGREGSDYTAAIIAFVLEAEKVIIWKDVPGVLNADPKWFDDTVLLEKISYKDAIELAFYGTSVIHPKTIQPLKKKSIPLYVKSFIEPDLSGTLVTNHDYDTLIPVFIFKMNQVLISISARDLSFIAEDYMEIILGAFARNGLNINLMQNSATSFQICVNNDRNRIDRIVAELGQQFNIEWENALELVTIRYFDEQTIERVTVQKEVILEQRNKTTAQMVMRNC